jgi:hypothetical protein
VPQRAVARMREPMPPAWTDWLTTLAWAGFGTVCILSGPAAAIEHGIAAGVGLAVVGLGGLLLALWVGSRVVVRRVRWMAEQEIAELRRQQAEVESGVRVDDGDTR